jgi:Flp pilus assembly protein TadG
MSKTKAIIKREKGQVLVIMAISLFALLIFVGLAIDGTQLFLNYTRLKRAVDSASVAAANDFRKNVSVAHMKAAAKEILDMQQVRDTVNIEVYMCDRLTVGEPKDQVADHPDGVTDAYLATDVPDFYKQCPKAGQLQKKLIYVRAFENSQTNFLTLLGIHSVPITTTAVSEAAPVDLVIVMDTSMSMGEGTAGYDPNTFNPGACNAAHNCQPLWQAKGAAQVLIDALYPGYDRVAIVSFDTVGVVRYALGNPTGAGTVLDNNVPLHEDPLPMYLSSKWDNYGNNKGRFNPINPEDRDNEGADLDTSKASTQCTIRNPLGTPDPNHGDRWDYTKNIPCDDKDYLDAFDWDRDGEFSSGSGTYPSCTPADSDHCRSEAWMYQHNASGLVPPPPISMVSTCTGCGIRVATDVLTKDGRSNAVWVMVFMTDGVANMSDTAKTFPYNATTKVGVPATYPNGYCGGQVVINGIPTPDPALPNYWLTYCQDTADFSIRRCINSDPQTCPPLSTPMVGSTYAAPYSPPYSVRDYARDMTDAAALRVNTGNPKEKLGNDVAIYSIMFTSSDSLAAKGAPLLRYMAAVGDDGDRTTDPCSGVADPKADCGQYYFANNIAKLTLVFRDIASRIYTKISE